MANADTFVVTEVEIEHVLIDHSLRVSDTEGKSFETMACELISEIDHERVINAALAAGSDFAERSTAAQAEIKNILVELGVIEF